MTNAIKVLFQMQSDFLQLESTSFVDTLYDTQQTTYNNFDV
jgi:hypothetical protein